MKVHLQQELRQSTREVAADLTRKNLASIASAALTESEITMFLQITYSNVVSILRMGGFEKNEAPKVAHELIVAI